MAISASVSDVILWTRNAPAKLTTSAAQTGSPSRECVDEPSLPNESGRGAFNKVARSKSISNFVSFVTTSGAASVMRVAFVLRAR